MPALFLEDWWGALSDPEKIYWTISIVFSVLFVIQFVLSLLGLDHDHDIDLDHGDADFGHADHTLDGFDSDFTIFSLRSIIAFFTFFGWAGVLVLSSGGPLFLAIIASFGSGLTAMFLVAYIMYMFIQLQSSGNMDIDNAIDQVGDVYLVIPPNKSAQGKVHIKIQGRLREMAALTDGKQIPTGSRIRVIDIIDNELLLVEPLDAELLLLEKGKE